MLKPVPCAAKPDRQLLRLHPAQNTVFQFISSRDRLSRLGRRKVVMECTSAISEVISRSDFGPAGFRWLTLSRIQVRYSSAAAAVYVTGCLVSNISMSKQI